MTVADFKRLPRQNHGSAQRFFWMIFRDEMMDYKGESRLAFHLSGKGRYLTSKLSEIWMNRKV